MFLRYMSAYVISKKSQLVKNIIGQEVKKGDDQVQPFTSGSKY
ncbi:hypothetical protein J6TS1_18830 [Siminovitchia terrae]|uniref:Uncharacterized protein n=1 Tax=Siminovitchia terrae TaxID=1914933 RepID=A0ABQ4KVG4_SIMTE|nr:hypothetical protein J6TS1_18830 [Siminovitchia terrae]